MRRLVGEVKSFVSVLRPARKLIDCHGHDWEIYVTRGLADLPGSLLRRSPHALHIEAVTFLPRRQAYLWTTTTDHVARVLDQIVAGLEAGELARPLGAVYRGRA
jgi:hypothetical protein